MHLVYPPVLHNHCFQFLLGITVVPREIVDNGYAKISGEGWRGTRCIMVYVIIVNSLEQGPRGIVR